MYTHLMYVNGYHLGRWAVTPLRGNVYQAEVSSL